MKKFPKILTILFLSFVIFQTGAFLFVNLFIEPVMAEPNASMPTIKNPFDDLQITIPGMKRFTEPFTCPSPNEDKTCIPWIGEYISGIYKYAIGIVGILAAVILMFGGFYG